MQNKKGQFVKGSHWRKRQAWWDKDWLYDQYVTCRKSAASIAQENGITEAGVLYWLKKHKTPRRTMGEIRAYKHWGLIGADNPMWNKRGELNPRWKGGITPERQGFYTSEAWKHACSNVWKRDNASCCRCGLYRDDQPDMPFHIHHIVSFANRELRADEDNLVLLCEACHHFVHSKRNTEHDYLSQV